MRSLGRCGGKNKLPRKKKQQNVPQQPKSSCPGRVSLRNKYEHRLEEQVRERAEHRSFLSMDHSDIARQMFSYEKRVDRALEVRWYEPHAREKSKYPTKKAHEKKRKQRTKRLYRRQDHVLSSVDEEG